MRSLALTIFVLLGCARAAEPPPSSYPLWDGQESVADYARRAKLPPAKTIDVGGGVKLDLLLIPAGTFTMGTPEAQAPVENASSAMALVVSSAALAVGLIAVAIVRSIRQRRRVAFSLGTLVAFVLATGALISGIVRWQRISESWREFDAAKLRYEAACGPEKPAHAVKLTRPFYMSKFEVTQAQFRAVLSRNPSAFEGRDHPVDSVSMHDAQEFCAKLKLRLPSEAEWEYACRAGSQSAYHSGDNEADLVRVAWFECDCGNSTHAVGQKTPNQFGLFDMHGNVCEWCRDMYGENYYRRSPAEDPQGPPALAPECQTVLRGGSWLNNALSCRSSQRCCAYSDVIESRNGFRVVMDVGK